MHGHVTLIVVLMAVCAVAMSGFGKGGLSGLGLLTTPLLALVIPAGLAAALMLPVLLIQDAISLWFYQGQYDRGNLYILLPTAIAALQPPNVGCRRPVVRVREGLDQ